MSSFDLADFVDKLGEPTGAPGGGAASAVSGALGAALYKMVAGVTLSLPRFTEGRDVLQTILEKSSKLVEEFENLSEKDTQAYLAVEAAFGLPKSTPEEKTLRKEKLQEAFKQATLVPLETARAAVSGLELVKGLLTYGNPNAITDVAVGTLLLDAAHRGASLNAEINLGSIKDDEFKKVVSEELEKLRGLSAQAVEAVREACSKASLTL